MCCLRVRGGERKSGALTKCTGGQCRRSHESRLNACDVWFSGDRKSLNFTLTFTRTDGVSGQSPRPKELWQVRKGSCCKISLFGAFSWLYPLSGVDAAYMTFGGAFRDLRGVGSGTSGGVGSGCFFLLQVQHREGSQRRGFRNLGSLMMQSVSVSSINVPALCCCCCQSESRPRRQQCRTARFEA